MSGVRLAPWEVAVAAIALALAFAGLSGRRPARQPYRERLQRRRAPGLPRR